MKKNVILTIEVGQREFLPTTFLASHFAKRGYRVFLATNRAVKILENKLQSCIFLHKSTIEKYALRYQRTLGAKVCFLDIESGIPMPDKRLEYWCHDRFQEVSPDKYHTVFAVGEMYKGIMTKMPQFEGINVVATGWPRFDVMLYRGGKIFRTEAEKIQRKYGKFILVVSSFGFVTKEEKLESIKIDKESFGEDYDNPAWHMFPEFLNLIHSLSRNSKLKVLVRPHPSESIQSWKNLLKDSENILIDGEGDINNYIMACEKLVQFRSSTTLEAALLGVENLSLRIDNEKFELNSPLYKLRREFGSIDELVNYVTNVSPDPEIIKKNAINLVKSHVSNLDGTACSKIIDVVDEINTEVTFSPILTKYNVLFHKLKMSFYDLVEKYFFSSYLSPKSWKFILTYNQKLSSPINTDTVQDCINSFNEGSRYSLMQISRDLVQIELDNAKAERGKEFEY